MIIARATAGVGVRAELKALAGAGARVEIGVGAGPISRNGARVEAKVKVSPYEPGYLKNILCI